MYLSNEMRRIFCPNHTLLTYSRHYVKNKWENVKFTYFILAFENGDNNARS